MSRPVGVYVHLPFCASKCAYCDFPSYAGQERLREAYTQALCAEIAERAARTGPLRVDTVFLGGGTPSLMAPGQLARILETLRAHYEVLPDAEITCEANPGTLERALLDTLAARGVNRLSLGAQSAHEDELRLLGRIHTWEQVAQSVSLARAAGFDNINLDLMSALPGQDWPGLRASLQAALSLKPAHLSCYSLILEEGTPLYERHARGLLRLPDEDTERQLYWNTVLLLEAAGYPRYEISNHCRPGHECRHNLNCWNYHDYLGFGLSAAGLLRGRRRKNTAGLRAYLDREPPFEEALSAADERFEMLMLALRTCRGLDEAAFASRFGLSLQEAWPQALPKHLDGGLLKREGGFLRLTDRGFDLMDRALVDFLPD